MSPFKPKCHPINTKRSIHLSEQKIFDPVASFSLFISLFLLRTWLVTETKTRLGSVKGYIYRVHISQNISFLNLEFVDLNHNKVPVAIIIVNIPSHFWLYRLFNIFFYSSHWYQKEMKFFQIILKGVQIKI